MDFISTKSCSKWKKAKIDLRPQHDWICHGGVRVLQLPDCHTKICAWHSSTKPIFYRFSILKPRCSIRPLMKMTTDWTDAATRIAGRSREVCNDLRRWDFIWYLRLKTCNTEDTPITAFISEDLADVFQAVRLHRTVPLRATKSHEPSFIFHCCMTFQNSLGTEVAQCAESPYIPSDGRLDLRRKQWTWRERKNDRQLIQHHYKRGTISSYPIEEFTWRIITINNVKDCDKAVDYLTWPSSRPDLTQRHAPALHKVNISHDLLMQISTERHLLLSSDWTWSWSSPNHWKSFWSRKTQKIGFLSGDTSMRSHTGAISSRPISWICKDCLDCMGSKKVVRTIWCHSLWEEDLQDNDWPTGMLKSHQSLRNMRLWTPGSRLKIYNYFEPQQN